MVVDVSRSGALIRVLDNGFADHAELDQLISDCLERSPDARPQSAQAIIDRLQTIIGQDTWTQADARNWWDRHPEWLGKDAGDK